MKIRETVSYALSRVSTAYRNSLERKMNEVGLHGGQVFILMELWKQDGQRQVDLASKIGVTTPTINKMILGLVQSGLVERTRLENDARSTRIFLTHRGTETQATV